MAAARSAAASPVTNAEYTGDILPRFQIVGHVTLEKHTEFVVALQHGSVQWLVARRYSHLRDLHHELAATLRQPAVTLPVFPPKRALGNKKETFLRQRQRDLHHWAQSLQERLSAQTLHERYPEACHVVVMRLALQHHVIRSCRLLHVVDPGSDEVMRGAVQRTGAATPALEDVARQLLERVGSRSDGLFGEDECHRMWTAAYGDSSPEEVSAQVLRTFFGFVFLSVAC